MVWWRSARGRVTWLVFAVIASCSVDDDDDYVFETEPKEVSGDAGEAADLGAAGANGSDPRGGAESGGGTAGLGGGSSGRSVGQGASPVAGGESNAGGLASSGGTLDATGGTTEPPTSTGGASTTPESCDCGSPECGEGVCVPAVPSGWYGPILLFHGAPALAPECTGYLNKTVFEGGTVPLQERLRCSACTCQETSGAECAALVTTYSDASCTTQTSAGNVTAACKMASPQALYFKAEKVESRASCLPSGGTQPPTWEWDARGCAPSEPQSGGCQEGAICMPQPTGGFEDTHCVYLEGDQTCPAEYPTKRSYLTRMVDERQCPSCSCKPVDGCRNTLAVYNNQSCMTDGPEFDEFHNTLDDTPGTCRELSPRFTPVAMTLHEEYELAHCIGVPVESPGTIHGEDPVTVCCR
jgi:hypothetical protein